MSKKTYVAAASTAFVLAATVSSVALAWHPEGKITKEVQNVTQASAYADANTASSAITARPGDTLRYRITITNPAPTAEKQDNDLAKIKVSDTIPTGVTAASAQMGKDFGTLTVVPQDSKSGNKSASYDFTVKVNANAKDGDVICNTASYTANSAVGDAPRSGSDAACVKVTVPPAPKQIKVCDLSTLKIVTINEDQFNVSKHSKDLTKCDAKPVTPVTPTTPTTPATPVTPETPATPATPVTPEVAPLPSTGPSTLLTAVAGTIFAALGYGGVALAQRRK